MSDANLMAAMTAPVRPHLSEGPVVIEARGVQKAFRIPRHRVDSVKERVTHPFMRTEYRELHALRGISFDVHKGEFFGIVGRNGSGKSTLLKILASIYKADAGRVRMAGRVAPFIELGVGFNPELTARENVVLNGVMMGLSRREARRRLDAVLEFAELEDFVELKLKNYSSGMMVRLAFAVMVQADADVMLIDEVLAVGDAAFSQKCMDVFREKRGAGKTIVLVTHDIATVQGMCDRAMLLHDGALEYIGHPDEACARYYRLNFADGRPEQQAAVVPDIHARLVDAWVEDRRGVRIDNVQSGEQMSLNFVVEARRELVRPVFAVHVMNAEGATVFTLETAPAGEADSLGRIDAGARVRVEAAIDNPLVPGRYSVNSFVFRAGERGGALQILRLPDLVVSGPPSGPGIVSVRADVRALPHPRAER
jgi:ABC-2 type transport system ATP-binding protein